MSKNNHYDIAIVGMSGAFPGADNLQEFWQNLTAGRESLQLLSEAQLRAAGVSETEWSRANYVPAAGVLNDIDMFAAEFFGYSPREAAQIDPQQRKLLEHTWHALEDASINVTRYAGTIGVFVGSSLNTYLLNNILSHPDAEKADDLQQILFGNGPDYLATRIAYLLNLRGAAINIQTACSTSLVAVHEACQYLLSYQVDAAIAGGVSIAVPQTKGYLHSVDGILSPDGHCRPFSENPQGTVFSSGLGVVVLKRFADAIADGDDIYAVIKGSAINNDGHQKVGYTAPSVDGQAEVIALAQGLSHVTPDQISYIETHGTATSLGDLIELSALQKIFSQTKQKQFCALGSLKSNIGHLDAAAGIAGLIKAALTLSQQKIPGTLHCEQPTTKMQWEDSAFFVNTQLHDWQINGDDLRYAGVSSFGIGGTNAHVVLGEVKQLPAVEGTGPALLIFSAKTLPELKQQLYAYSDYCKQHPDTSLHRMARTLQEGRAEFNYRAAMVVDTLADAIHYLDTSRYSLSVCEKVLETITPKRLEQYTVNDLENLMQQWLQGHVIDWSAYYQQVRPRKLHLPVYPFTRSRYWIDAYKTTDESENKRLAMDDWFYLPGWRKSILTGCASVKQDDVLVIFGAANLFNTERLHDIPSLGKILTVIPGMEFNQINENLFAMDFTDPHQYMRLLNELKSTHALPTHLLHALSFTKQAEKMSIDVFNRHQEHGLLSVIYFMQAWEKIAAETRLKLTVLINRLNQVANEDNLEPHKAPLLSAVKVIPKEYIHIETQLIDLDVIDRPQFAAYQLKQLEQEIYKPKYDQEEIVYRGVQRWLRDYIPAPVSAPAHKPAVTGSGKVILITGGLGQLGLDIAEYFSQAKTCKIALLARTQVPQEREWKQVIASLDSEHPLSLMLQRIMAMRQQGAMVEVFSADVSVSSSLEYAIQTIEASLGQITGVVHAAGETVNGIISLKTLSSLQESYQAKVFGTYHLHTLLKRQSLDFFIICSSMNAVIGGLGQLDNTAANAFIDYMADYISAETGQNVFAINWGAVNVNRPMKVNVLHQFMELSTEHKKNNMTDDEVNQIYDRLLTTRLGSRVVISTIDMNSVLKSWNRVASIEELAKDRPSYQQHQVRVLEQHEVPSTAMQQWVSEQWQHLLGFNVIGLQDNFFAIGGHSLAAVQFMTKVKEAFNIKTHVMNLYELPTLQAFSDFLEKQIKQKQPVKLDAAV